ncbi:hypothetical protein IHE45_15G056900 [Dioscorea alata]|uniref:Uncharacterized protein n=1 Tax=Dioscorea alata TaxID=55571 RepID=A0ACB7ULQ4_DIOAL|nr:hypothetical protein IHE45_15G056900 [Dioscorea alata]
MRKCDKEVAYDPVVVAIGPYHHGLANDSTVPAMQDFKWDCVRRLLSRRTKSSSEATSLFRSCLLKMKEMDDLVRDCYSENLHHLSPHDLGMIMLLDGCFIIHLLLKFNERNFKLTEMVNLKEESTAEARDIVEEKEGSMAKAQEKVELDMGREKSIDGRLEGMDTRISAQFVHDLLKIENQIPFFIVCELFVILKSSEDGEINLVKIACNLLQVFLNLKHGGEPPANEAGSPSMASRCYFWRLSQIAYVRRASMAHVGIPFPDETEIPFHLLHLFHSRLKPSVTCDEANSSETGRGNEWIPTASELGLAGIKFEENKEANSFLDISFKNNGIIKIPQLYIEDFTSPLFKNLIAFEQCSADASKYITSYIMFMDYLINTSRDVQLLEQKGILVNLMGTDDAAASLFNGLGKNITYNSGQMYLWGLHRNVKNYYNSWCHKQRARLIRDYFSSPWAILSFLAALVLLLLTAQQSFFSAYSYFRPPHA